MERASLGGVAWHDDGFQCRRREPVLLGRRSRDADRVADLDVAEAPELPDLSCGDRVTPDGRAAVEHTERGNSPHIIAAESQPIAHAYGSREHPHIRDLLPGRPAFDLEHGARYWAIRIVGGSVTLGV